LEFLNKEKSVTVENLTRTVEEERLNSAKLNRRRFFEALGKQKALGEKIKKHWCWKEKRRGRNRRRDAG